MEFHQAHAHWHYQFFRYELYEMPHVHPTKPWKKIKLGQRTVGSKVGFCPSDERLTDWDRFYQLRCGRWADDRSEEDVTFVSTDNMLRRDQRALNSKANQALCALGFLRLDLACE